MHVLHIVAGILIVYALLSLVWPLRYAIRKRYLFILSLLVIFCGSKFWIYAYNGSVFRPSLNAQTQLIMEACFSVLALAVILAMLRDIGHFVWWLCSKSKTRFKQFTGFDKAKSIRHRLRSTAIIAAIAIATGFYGTYSQLLTPSVQEITLSTSEDFPKLKVVQLSDLHIGPILQQDFLERVVKRTNELQPDLILITGDFQDGTVSGIGHMLKPLSKLKATYGVYAVAGNHEYYWGAQAWFKHFKKLGIKLLFNESVKISHQGKVVQVVGVPDPQGVNFGIESPNYSKAKRNVIAGSNKAADYTILIAHQPNILRQNVDANLTMTGHTHGGTMFFLKPIIASYNDDFVSGLYPLKGERYLYVHNGTGIWSGFSCRVLVPSEITLFSIGK